MMMIIIIIIMIMMRMVMPTQCPPSSYLGPKSSPLNAKVLMKFTNTRNSNGSVSVPPPFNRYFSKVQIIYLSIITSSNSCRPHLPLFALEHLSFLVKCYLKLPYILEHTTVFRYEVVN